MNNHNRFLKISTVLCAAVVASISTTGIANAAAVPFPATMSIDNGSSDPNRTINWGENSGGWKVDVRNDSNISLSEFGEGLISNIASHSVGPSANGGQATVQGKRSDFGGPADIDFYFTYPSDRSDFSGQGIGVRIGYTLGDYQPDVNCRSVGTPPQKVTCKVQKSERTKAIELVVTNA